MLLLEKPIYLFWIKATIRAETMPIESEPRNMTVNLMTQPRSSSLNDLVLSYPITFTVSYITMAMASLKILSPKTTEYRLTSASISLKIARTATGSVALINEPKAKLSLSVN